MRRYKSKKIVEAAKILQVEDHPTLGGSTEGAFVALLLEVDDRDPSPIDRVNVDRETWIRRLNGRDPRESVGGYLVRYEDGYQSWSPAEAFDNGYDPIDPRVEPD